jgi:hypothetical protein
MRRRYEPAKILRNATLRWARGCLHPVERLADTRLAQAMLVTSEDRINQDLLEFIKEWQ